jgi:hypothetical protein
MARILWLLLVLTSATSTHAATWYLQGSGEFSAFGSFDYTAAGGYGALNLYMPQAPSFPPLNLPTFVDGDATFLQASNYNTDGFYTSMLTLQFVTPLTDLGGTVAVAPYPESNWNVFFTNDCDGVCYGPGVTSVTTVAPVPLPNTALLMLVAVSGLAMLHRNRQLQNRGPQLLVA